MSEQPLQLPDGLDILHRYIGWRVVVTLRDGEVYMGRIARLADTELEIGSVRPDLTPERIPLQYEDIDQISVRHEPWLPQAAEGPATERRSLLKRVSIWLRRTA